MHRKIIASLLLSTFAFAAEQEKVEEMGVTQISSKVSHVQANEDEPQPDDSSLNTAFIAEDEEGEELEDNMSIIEGNYPEFLESDTE